MAPVSSWRLAGEGAAQYPVPWLGQRLPEVDETSRRGLEATGVEVERGQLLGEVDMKPLAACRPRLSNSDLDQSGGDALVLMGSTGLGVKKERMYAAVPGHVDEPYEGAVLLPRRHPPEASGAHSIPPADLGFTTVSLDKLDHLGIFELSSPLIGIPHRHSDSLPQSDADERMSRA